jgi:hypothetical protein
VRTPTRSRWARWIYYFERFSRWKSDADGAARIREYRDAGNGVTGEGNTDVAMATTSPDGMRSKTDHTEELEITVLEKTAIDPMLFGVPAEYKKIEHRYNAGDSD